MNVVAGLAEVERRVRADFFETERVPGWESRGSGVLVPRGKVNHWTAGPRSGDAPSLRVVTFGREGLRNALANTYSSRRPKLYIIAARTAWHAGRGSWHGITGNNSVLGHEPECSGPGDWSQEHIHLMLSLDRAQVDVFGYGVQMVCDHFEWAKPQGRKPDRGDIGGPPWRARVAAWQPTPADQEDEDMIKFNEKSDRVRRLQRVLSLYLYFTGGWTGNGTKYADLPPERNPLGRTEGAYLIADGHYGPATAEAMWHAARRWELNRRVGGAATLLPFDSRNPDLDVVAAIIAHLDAYLAENKV